MSAAYPDHDWPPDWSCRHIRAVIADSRHSTDATQRELRNACDEEIYGRFPQRQADAIQRTEGWARR